VSRKVGIVLMVLLIAGTGSLYGITRAGTVITNKAVVNASNIPNAISNSVTTNVDRIAGGWWTRDADTSGSTGSLVSNMSYLTNLGNDDWYFQVKVTNFNRSGANTAGPWSWSIRRGATVIATGSSNSTAWSNIGIINMGAVSNIVFRVQVAATAADSSWEEWSLMARITNTHVNTVWYTGSNGNRYGGQWGVVYSDRVVWTNNTEADLQWRVTVSGPVLAVNKYIDAINDPLGGNLPIPGARIQYRIHLTNTGSAAAMNVMIRDTIQTQYLESIGNHSATIIGDSRSEWSSNYTAPVLKWSNYSGSGFAQNAGGNFYFTAVIK